MGFELMFGDTQFEADVQEMENHLSTLGVVQPLILARALLTLETQHPCSIDDLQKAAFVSSAIQIFTIYGIAGLPAIQSHWIELNTQIEHSST
jgi:hypothetical protein